VAAVLLTLQVLGQIAQAVYGRARSGSSRRDGDSMKAGRAQPAGLCSVAEARKLLGCMAVSTLAIEPGDAEDGVTRDTRESTDNVTPNEHLFAQRRERATRVGLDTVSVPDTRKAPPRRSQPRLHQP